MPPTLHAPRPRAVASPPRPARRRDRGAALLVVVSSIAIITAVAVDLAYNTRVSLQVAANARDELRATYLAKSAVNLSRLVLHFQQQLDQTAGTAMIPVAAQPGAAAPAFAFRLWEVVPVDSASAAMFLGGGGPPRAPAPAAAPREGSLFAEAGAPRAFGDYEGSFKAQIEDEDRKIAVSSLAALMTSGVPGAQVLRLQQLVKDPRYDFLFDRDDAYGNRFSRNDLVVNLKDWVDEDDVTSALTGNPMQPFAPAFGDESFAYDKGPDRYRTKNGRYDSLEELYMVGGVSDAFMAAFGDKLTVYPKPDAPINVNTTDPAQVQANILVMTGGVLPPGVQDPTFMQRLQAAVDLIRPLPFMSISVQQVAMILQGLGVPVSPMFMQSTTASTSNPFDNRSRTFHIRATGAAGAVTKTIDAVVTVDDRAGPLAYDLGRLLHWREE